MFVDELTIHVKAGNGGDGVVRWLHEKFKEYLGPAGGNGGRGGDAYARAVRDIGILARYRTVKEFRAERGDDGGNKNMQGKSGEDLYIDFPIGSRITNLSTGKIIELMKEGETALLLQGGRGGLGNEYYKSSVNTHPTKSTPGSPGEESDFHVELDLIADAGLIGLPNAGKSSLLNVLTRASAKVGSYAFTTLEPNLGDLYGYILADIPGLIEGAAEGRGLGHKFLRHVRRTKMLIHCVSLESKDVAHDYKVIRDELKKFDPVLADKKEIVILTKTDLVEPEIVSAAREKITAVCAPGTSVVATSVEDPDSVKVLSDLLVKELV